MINQGMQKQTLFTNNTTSHEKWLGLFFTLISLSVPASMNGPLILILRYNMDKTVVHHDHVRKPKDKNCVLHTCKAMRTPT